MKNIPHSIKGRYAHIYSMLPEKAKTILDYGSNEGYFAEAIREGYKNKTKMLAAEIDSEYIRIGKEKYPELTFLKIIPTKKFRISNIDVIILSDVIEHIPKNTEKKLIKELHGYLKKDGILLLSTPNKDPLLLAFVSDPANFIIQPLIRIIKKLKIPSVKTGEKYMWEKNTESWHRHYSISELKELCSENFEIVEFKRRGSFLTPLFYFTILLVDMPLAYIDKNRVIHGIREIWRYIPQKIVDFDIRYISLGIFSYHITIKCVRK